MIAFPGPGIASQARLTDCSSLNGDRSPLDKSDFFNNHRSLTDQPERLRLAFLHAGGRSDARLHHDVMSPRADVIQRKKNAFASKVLRTSSISSGVSSSRCVRIEHAIRETGEISDYSLEGCRECLQPLTESHHTGFGDSLFRCSRVQ